MKTIKISKELEIPLMDYATQATALMGIKGAGKSMSGGFLAEQLMTEGIPITALDPAGVWRYLKVPGRGDGFPVVVVGGEDSDFPLSEHTVEDITRAAMKEGVSLVIDLFTSRPSKNLIRNVVLKCVETMFYENKKHGVRHVFLEEAAEVAPQRIMADHARVYGAVEQLVRIGGNCSLGVTMINPRAENLNKDVLELCDFMFLHRQRGRNSLKNLDDWFEQSNMTPEEIDNVIATTMRLEAGRCWFMSKASEHPILVQMPIKRSFHPDRKNPQAEIKAVKRTVDVAAWVEKLKAALPKPEEKKPVAAKTAMVPAPAPTIEYVDRPVVTESDFSLLANVLDSVRAQKSQIVSFEASVLELRMKIEALMQKQKFNRPIAPAPSRIIRESKPARQFVAEDSDRVLEVGKGGKRRMLIALAQRMPLTRAQLGMRANITLTGGTFSTYTGDLKTMGLIEEDHDGFTITQEGFNELGSFDKLPTGQALLEFYINKLGDSGKARMLRELADVYPDPLTKTDLGERAQITMTGGTFSTYVGDLSTLELITKTPDGKYRASDEFFA